MNPARSERSPGTHHREKKLSKSLDSSFVTTPQSGSDCGATCPTRARSQYTLASDTLVEAPAIAERIESSLRRMNEAAEAAGLPLTAHKVIPAVDESFWVNLIGRGYPAPYARFRWRTERMKIKPTNRFVMEKVTEHGEVVVVLGVRKLESFTREQVINLHKITGSRLSRHAMLPGAYVYAPITGSS